jgi:hypothetical protein
MDENPYQAPQHYCSPKSAPPPPPVERAGDGTDWYALIGLAIGVSAAVVVGTMVDRDEVRFGQAGTSDELVAVAIVGICTLTGWTVGRWLRQS